MTVHWKLKTYLATKHDIYKAVAFQKLITKKTGILISVQNLCNYLEKKPKRIPLKTLELFVTALDCSLEDFCLISPLKSVELTGAPKKLAYQNTPGAKRAVKNFPNPQDYE